MITPMTAYSNSTLSDWQYLIAIWSTSNGKQNSAPDIFNKSKLDDKPSHFISRSRIFCRRERLPRTRNASMTQSIRSSLRTYLTKTESKDEFIDTDEKTNSSSYVEPKFRRSGWWNSVDRRSKRDCSAPSERERAVLRCVDSALLDRERKSSSSCRDEFLFNWLRSLKRRSMHSSRRIIIKPFSFEMAALLKTRINFLITFSIEKNWLKFWFSLVSRSWLVDSSLSSFSGLRTLEWKREETIESEWFVWKRTKESSWM